MSPTPSTVRAQAAARARRPVAAARRSRSGHALRRSSSPPRRSRPTPRSPPSGSSRPGRHRPPAGAARPEPFWRRRSCRARSPDRRPRESFFSASSADARAMIMMSERSSRALSVMKMFSASESTHATTPVARSTPACWRCSSSGRRPLEVPDPLGPRDLPVVGIVVNHHARGTRAERRSRYTWRPTRPKPQMMKWSWAESIIL